MTQPKQEMPELLKRLMAARRDNFLTGQHINIILSPDEYDAKILEAYQVGLSTAEAANRELRETLTWVLNDVQEWCEAVERDSSWDSWYWHYKSFFYNGGLEKARADLAASTASQPATKEG